jgi:hypothetical protein
MAGTTIASVVWLRDGIALLGFDYFDSFMAGTMVGP